MSREEKAPALPWYARDFAADGPVQLMSLLEEGAYRRLLDFQWLNGSIPSEITALARICKGIPEREMRRIWAVLEPLFPEKDGEIGVRQNRKMERVRAERQAFIDHQRESGSRGGKESSRRRKEQQAYSPASSKPSSKPTSEPTRLAAASLVAEIKPAVCSLQSASASKSSSVPSEPREPRSDSVEPKTPEPPAAPVVDVPRHAGHVIATVRKVLWAPDGKPPGRVVAGRPWTEDREMSVVQALIANGESAEDCIKVCHGLKMLQSQGDVAWLESGKISLLAVYHTKDGPRDMFTQALDAYARGIPPPEPKAKRGGPPAGMGEILDFSKFAREAKETHDTKKGA